MTWVTACEVDIVDPEDVVPFAHGGEDDPTKVGSGAVSVDVP
jgi:hypothetical protein